MAQKLTQVGVARVGDYNVGEGIIDGDSIIRSDQTPTFAHGLSPTETRTLSPSAAKLVGRTLPVDTRDLADSLGYSPVYTDTRDLEDGVEATVGLIIETRDMAESIIRVLSRPVDEQRILTDATQAIALAFSRMLEEGHSLTNVVTTFNLNRPIDEGRDLDDPTVDPDIHRVLTLLESRLLSDSFVKGFSTTLQDNRAFTEALLQAVGLVASEGRGLADEHERALGRPVVETRTLADEALSAWVLAAITEVRDLDDLLGRGFEVPVGDTRDLGDALTQSAVARTLSEQRLMNVAIIRALARTVVQSHDLDDLAALPVTNITNIRNLADTFIRGIGKVGTDERQLSLFINQSLQAEGVLTETRDLAESIIRAIAREVGESHTYSDAIELAQGVIRSETRTLADSLQRDLAITQTESRNLAEALLFELFRPILEERHLDIDIKAANTALATDTRTLSDIIERAIANVFEEERDLDETPLLRGLTGAIDEFRFLSEATTRDLTRLLVETLTRTDTFDLAAGFAFTDSRNLADSLTRALSRLVTDDRFLEDFGDDIKTILSKAFTELRNLDDGALSFILARAVTETRNLADALERGLAITKVEGRNLADIVTRDTVRTLTEGRLLSDATVPLVGRIIDESRLLDESLTALDFDLTRVETRTLTEFLAKAITRSLEEARDLDDPFTTGLVGKFLTETRSLLDAHERDIGKAVLEPRTLGEADTTFSMGRPIEEVRDLQDLIEGVAGLGFEDSRDLSDETLRGIGIVVDQARNMFEDTERLVQRMLEEVRGLADTLISVVPEYNILEDRDLDDTIDSFTTPLLEVETRYVLDTDYLLLSEEQLDALPPLIRLLLELLGFSTTGTTLNVNKNIREFLDREDETVERTLSIDDILEEFRGLADDLVPIAVDRLLEETRDLEDSGTKGLARELVEDIVRETFAGRLFTLDFLDAIHREIDACYIRSNKEKIETLLQAKDLLYWHNQWWSESYGAILQDLIDAIEDSMGKL